MPLDVIGHAPYVEETRAPPSSLLQRLYESLSPESYEMGGYVCRNDRRRVGLDRVATAASFEIESVREVDSRWFSWLRSRSCG